MGVNKPDEKNDLKRSVLALIGDRGRTPANIAERVKVLIGGLDKGNVADILGGIEMAESIRNAIKEALGLEE